MILWARWARTQSSRTAFMLASPKLSGLSATSPRPVPLPSSFIGPGPCRTSRLRSSTSATGTTKQTRAKRTTSKCSVIIASATRTAHACSSTLTSTSAPTSASSTRSRSMTLPTARRPCRTSSQSSRPATPCCESASSACGQRPRSCSCSTSSRPDATSTSSAPARRSPRPRRGSSTSTPSSRCKTSSAFASATPSASSPSGSHRARSRPPRSSSSPTFSSATTPSGSRQPQTPPRAPQPHSPSPRTKSRCSFSYTARQRPSSSFRSRAGSRAQKCSSSARHTSRTAPWPPRCSRWASQRPSARSAQPLNASRRSSETLHPPSSALQSSAARPPSSSLSRPWVRMLGPSSPSSQSTPPQGALTQATLPSPSASWTPSATPFWPGSPPPR
eukprot:Amastigsp_a678820_5.p2 type:complete len:389 gc:universal Amastigsp_a678820_5:61-1227(+)